MASTTHLPAAEAAARLGVSRSTLYAYVSRGMIHSRAVPGSRRREYALADVEALLQRQRGRRDPATVAREALEVRGLPVLSSALSSIDAGRLYYRGLDAITLAEQRPLEQIAELLWAGPFPDAAPYSPPAAARRRLAALPFVERCHAYLASAGAQDPGAYHLEAASARRVGATILRGLAGVAVGAAPSRAPIAELLARAWTLGPDAQAKLSAALVLCADHELNVSAFTARCVASAGATPYMAVTAALAALRGHKHGGHTQRIAALLDERGAPSERLARRLRRGERIPGFGHPLYPEGDPRGRALMQLARGRRSRRAHAFAQSAEPLLSSAPSLDFGLVTLARDLGLGEEAPLILFALGRCVGWIGHCIEQYASDQLIRPRARYIGPPPVRPEPS